MLYLRKIKIISLSLFFAEEVFLEICTRLMAIDFVQYLSMISPENVNLDQTKLKNFINFKSKF